uniref:Transposase n=1 Tax=Ditylenchus dipsaci TaxID=166011 RepID=A0A915CMZ8_9BILA
MYFSANERCLSDYNEEGQLISAAAIALRDTFAMDKISTIKWLACSRLIKNWSLCAKCGDVVDYMAKIREACDYYCDHQPLIGGEGKIFYCSLPYFSDFFGEIIETDESAFSRPKHHRRAPKGGHSRWMFGGIERGEGGKQSGLIVVERKISIRKFVLAYFLEQCCSVMNIQPTFVSEVICLNINI